MGAFLLYRKQLAENNVDNFFIDES
jgi:hypothetical protein